MDIITVCPAESEIAFSKGTAVYFMKDNNRIASLDHTDIVRGIVKAGNYWVSISDDKTIKFHCVNWESSQSEVLYTLVHGKKPNSLVFLHNQIVFADKTGEAWKIDVSRLRSGKTKEVDCAAFAMGHQSTITYMQKGENSLITVDKDNKIKISESPNFYEVRSVLLGHNFTVLSAIEYEGKIYSSDESGCIKKWNGVEEEVSIQTMEAVQLFVANNKILGVSKSGYFYVNPRNLQSLPIELEPFGITSVWENYIYQIDSELSIRQFDLRLQGQKTDN